MQNSRRCSSSPLHLSGRRDIPFGSSSVKHHLFRRRELSAWTPISVQKLRTVQGCIRSDVSATRRDVIQCLTSNRISISDTVMGRRLQTVRTLSLIRQGVEQKFKRPDVSLHCPDAQPLLWK